MATATMATATKLAAATKATAIDVGGCDTSVLLVTGISGGLRLLGRRTSAPSPSDIAEVLHTPPSREPPSLELTPTPTTPQPLAATRAAVTGAGMYTAPTLPPTQPPTPTSPQPPPPRAPPSLGLAGTMSADTTAARTAAVNGAAATPASGMYIPAGIGPLPMNEAWLLERCHAAERALRHWHEQCMGLQEQCNAAQLSAQHWQATARHNFPAAQHWEATAEAAAAHHEYQPLWAQLSALRRRTLLLHRGPGQLPSNQPLCLPRWPSMSGVGWRLAGTVTMPPPPTCRRCRHHPPSRCCRRRHYCRHRRPRHETFSCSGASSRRHCRRPSKLPGDYRAVHGWAHTDAPQKAGTL